MKIYCVHPISGLSGEEVMSYYSKIYNKLKAFGYNVLYPMVGKGEFRNEKEFAAKDYANGNPLTSNHAIFSRDKWMVQQADIVYASFIGSKSPSIGSIFELAWAHLLGKHIVVAMEDFNPHQHAFILEAANIIFKTEQDAEEYLYKLFNRLP